MSLIDLTIKPQDKDLGSFSVRRLLPSVQRQTVGPFIFLDHMGPAHFASGQGIDVRPHPHIGLSTLTYLFSGNITHKDNIGSVQEITPGAVNWMTAGRGISHSERTTPLMRTQPHETHGLQSWIALPKAYEEILPEFHHHAAETLPVFEIKGVSLTLIAGSAYGYEAPVKIYSPLFYLQAKMPAGTSLLLGPDYAQRALYLIEGTLHIGNTLIRPKTMPIFAPNENICIKALTNCHIMLLGGAPLSEPRFVDWNFVSSSKERIEQAKQDWRLGHFAKIPGDDKEFIPLP